jgi:hypothetical protein
MDRSEPPCSGAAASIRCSSARSDRIDIDMLDDTLSRQRSDGRPGASRSDRRQRPASSSKPRCRHIGTANRSSGRNTASVPRMKRC